MQIQLHLPNILAAVGEKLQLLIRLHPVRLQKLKQTTLGSFIVRLHESEASAGEFRFLFWYPAERQDALALAAHIPAIDANGERTIRSRKFVPVSLASFDKAIPFLAQFPLQAFGHI